MSGSSQHKQIIMHALGESDQQLGSEWRSSPEESSFMSFPQFQHKMNEKERRKKRRRRKKEEEEEGRRRR